MQFELDLEKFWEENERCFKHFSTDKPRVPVSYWLDDHFLFEAVELSSTLKYYQDREYRLQVHKKINEITREELGRTFYPEQEMKVQPERFEVLLGSHREYTEGGTPWLESEVETISDLRKLNEKNSKLKMGEVALPEGFAEEKVRFEEETGQEVKLGGGFSRGPVTMATSILGTENTCLFVMDYEQEMKEFFNILADKLIEYHYVLLEATDNNNEGGYQINDDNCYLFPPQQYQRLCAPFMEKIFAEFAPEPGDRRHQHSDSSMGHLMPILRDLGVNQVNLGPELHPLEIREAMPETVICGQTPPLVLRDGSPEEIVDMVKRDIEAVGGDGGLVETPAGSVAAGTSFKNLRIYMWAVQEYGGYQ